MQAYRENMFAVLLLHTCVKVEEISYVRKRIKFLLEIKNFYMHVMKIAKKNKKNKNPKHIYTDILGCLYHGNDVI